MRLSFGMLTVLTKIRSTKVLWLMEDDLWRKTTFGGRRPSIEEELGWKTTFGQRQPSVDYNLRWKMTLGERQPSVEDDLQWVLACFLVCFAAFFLS